MLRDREHLGAHEAQGVFRVFMAVPGCGAGGGSSCCDTNPIPVPRSCRHLPVPLSRRGLVCVPPWEVPGELPGPCPLLRESLAPSALLIPGFIQAVKAEPAPFSCPSPPSAGCWVTDKHSKGSAWGAGCPSPLPGTGAQLCPAELRWHRGTCLFLGRAGDPLCAPWPAQGAVAGQGGFFLTRAAEAPWGWPQGPRAAASLWPRRLKHPVPAASL